MGLGRPRAAGEEARALDMVTQALFGEERSRAGRYQILDRVGGGGEGVIYLGYDPELNRQVALKFPRLDVGRVGERQRIRLLREATALARLSHPNVVPVYDVFITDDEICLVSEFVRGQTLRAWLRETPRTPRQIVEAFQAAGGGLAAVHAAGLVHRDFKPENVIVGDDGRVRVLDFGLARLEPVDLAETITEIAGEFPERSSSLPHVTATGAGVGTPLYMAPEQHHGREVDASADQWSFCLALAEALLGRYPLPHRDVDALIAAKENRIRLPLIAGVPRRWLRALERGLDPDPDQRWGSLEELGRALDRRRRSLRPAFAASLVAIGLAGVALGALAPPGVELASVACAEAPGLDAVWNDERRARVKRGLYELREPHIPVTFERVQSAVDGFAGRWWTRWNHACEAADVGELDAETLAAERACLVARSRELDATLDSLDDPTAQVARRIPEALAELTSPDRCAEPAHRARWRDRPDDSKLAREVDAAYEALAQALALHRLGDNHRALDRLTEIRATVPAHRPLEVELQYQWAVVAMDLGRHRDAIEPLRSAHFAAEELGEGYGWIALGAAMSLASAHGVHHVGDPQATQKWLGYAEAVAQRESDADPLHHANLRLLRANILLASQSYDAAIEEYQSVIDDYRDALGHGPDLRVFAPRQNLGIALLHAGRSSEAIEQLDTAVSEMEELLGPAHPGVANALSNLGSACNVAGNHECAAEAYQELEPLVREYFGPTDALTAAFAHGMGGVHMNAERPRLAHRYRVEALEVATAVYGERHPQTAIIMHGLADVEIALGELSAARERLGLAIEIFDEHYGDGNRYTIGAHERLGALEYEAGDLEKSETHLRAAIDGASGYGAGALTAEVTAASRLGELYLDRRRATAAVELLQRAVELRTEHDGAFAAGTVLTRASLARAQAAVGEKKEASRTLESVQSDASKLDLSPRLLATLRLREADAAWRLGDHERAEALVVEAETILATAPSGTQNLRSAVARWRASHSR